TDLETDRHFGNIDIARVTIKIAVSNTKSVLPAAQRLSVIDREQTCRAASSSSRSDGRGNISRVTLRSRSLSRSHPSQCKQSERYNERLFREFHHIPPANKIHKLQF